MYLSGPGILPLGNDLTIGSTSVLVMGDSGVACCSYVKDDSYAELGGPRL